MSKEGSIAPKERVNIVYKSSVDGNEDVELPLKILAVGDYTGQVDQRPLAERKPINIDKDNFRQVMAEQKLGLKIQVPDKLGDDEEAELTTQLRFNALSDFSPEGLVNQVPELKKLMALRDALTELKYPLSNISDFRARLRDMLTDEEMRNKLIAEVSSIEHGSDSTN